MNVSDLSNASLLGKLSRQGIALRTGSYVTRIQSSIPLVGDGIRLLYANYPVEEDDCFCDFQVKLAPPTGVRRWVRPQCLFFADGHPPFKPLPYPQAFPMLEWGMNWCISSHCHDHLVIHAAVIEKNGRAAVLPAPPGSGKSTLCATLIANGWRLLSDELTLVRIEDGAIAPLPRPVSLKNQSIDIIRKHATAAVISPVVRDTVKGTVAHMKAPPESVTRAMETARPGWVIFPRFLPDSEVHLEKVAKVDAFRRVAENAFNYTLLGASGFLALSHVIDRSDCFDFTYSRLDDAVTTFDGLACAHHGQ